MTEKKINRIPLSEGEMTMLMEEVGHFQPLTFGIPSGDLIGPFPWWAVEKLARHRGFDPGDPAEFNLETD